MKKKKFKIKLFGEVFDYPSLSALEVEILGQEKLDNAMPNCFKVNVMAFDESHIKLRVYRNLKYPTDLNALRDQHTFLQQDKFLLFPDLSLFPDWGGYFVVTSNCQNVLDEINEDRQEYRGSKLTALRIQSTIDYIDVEMYK